MKPLYYVFCPVAVLSGLLSMTGCKQDDHATPETKVYHISPGPNAQEEAIAAMIDVQSGEIIEFGEGTFTFNRSLILKDKENVTLRGKGRDRTILDFETQVFDAEGLKITGKLLMLADFTVQNTPGDAIKIENTDGLTLRNIGAVWPGNPDSTNGAYGLYPVKCTNVLIEGCYAQGASDAGIYVGQSEQVIVRNSTARGNVSGIEIENTTHAEVSNCTAEHNTAGILVFDLPNLPKKNGSHIRVLGNTIRNNNTPNFARPGTIVGQVPSGTGVLVMATKHVEVFNNEISGNNVIGTGVISYGLLGALNPRFTYTDPAYNPYTGNVYVHDNRYTSQKQVPDVRQLFGAVLRNFFGDDCPDILFDGLREPSAAAGNICFRSNGTVEFATLNAAGGFAIDRNLTPFDCSLTPVAAPVVTAP